MDLVLYHNPISTCGQKVRLALAEKRLDWESRIIDWSKQDHLSDWYLNLNPNGVVPTLLAGGEPVIDSSVICEFLEEQFPGNSIAPATPIDRSKMRAWMRYSEEVATPAIRVPSYNRLFVKGLRTLADDDYQDLVSRLPIRKHFYQSMGEGGFSQQLYDQAIEKLSQTLSRMDAALSDGRDFLLGDYSIADIVLIPSIVRLEDLELTELWADRPNVQRWYAAVQARPSFPTAYFPGSRVDPATYEMNFGETEAC